MTLWAFTSLSESPGVTTTALLVAAGSDPPALVVEADPFGGSLGARFGLAPRPGLATLAAARRDRSPEALRTHLQVLPGGLEVVVGLPSLAQSQALATAWDSLADAVGALGQPVVVDAGRLTTEAGAPRALLGRADVLIVVARPELSQIARLRAAREMLVGINPKVVLVLVGERPYGPAEVGAACDIEIAGILADDPGTAALAGGGAGSGRALRRSALVRSAAALAQALSVRSTATPTGAPPEPVSVAPPERAERTTPVAEEVSL